MFRILVHVSILLMVSASMAEGNSADPMPITPQHIDRYVDLVKQKRQRIIQTSSHGESVRRMKRLLIEATEDIGYDYEATVIHCIHRARQMHTTGKYDQAIYDAWQIFAIGAAMSREMLYGESLISRETKQLLDEVAARAGL
jgi:hypothetical protein